MEQKVFLRGEGVVQNIDKPDTSGPAVPYNAGASAMADLVDDSEAALAEKDVESELKKFEAPEVITEQKELPISSNPGFDETIVQDARKDDSIEGGVTNPAKSTGPMKYNGDAASEGGRISKEPLADSTPGAYELSGFHVEVKSATGMVSVQITQDFKDLAVAKASVNGGEYLMPVKPQGFIPCRITRGAPIICFEERQILEYVNGQWRRP